jgi:hypothetical protein
MGDLDLLIGKWTVKVKGGIPPVGLGNMSFIVTAA